jgi:3alpha(or 20beta)-hydroxysteroid dehydrogenase
MERFHGKVVLISGGARGQGAAEARMLVAEGAKVVIGDLREEEGRRLAAELGKAVTFVRHDVTVEPEWASAVAAAENQGGRFPDLMPAYFRPAPQRIAASLPLS